MDLPKSSEALSSWRRATSAIDAPSKRLSSTIRRFSSRVQDRRLRPTGAKSPSLPTDITDGAHHRIVDTIIEPLFRQLSRTSTSMPGGRCRRDTWQYACSIRPRYSRRFFQRSTPRRLQVTHWWGPLRLHRGQFVAKLWRRSFHRGSGSLRLQLKTKQTAIVFLKRHPIFATTRPCGSPDLRADAQTIQYCPRFCTPGVER